MKASKILVNYCTFQKARKSWIPCISVVSYHAFNFKRSLSSLLMVTNRVIGRLDIFSGQELDSFPGALMIKKIQSATYCKLVFFSNYCGLWPDLANNLEEHSQNWCKHVESTQNIIQILRKIIMWPELIFVTFTVYQKYFIKCFFNLIRRSNCGALQNGAFL